MREIINGKKEERVHPNLFTKRKLAFDAHVLLSENGNKLEECVIEESGGVGVIEWRE
jgi:hypothetical protein